MIEEKPGSVDGIVADRDAVEAAHRAFYAAWEAGDLDAACGVWHESDDICCIFPGDEPAIGRQAVCDRVGEGFRVAPGLQFLFEHVDVSLQGDFARLTCIENVVTPDAFEVDDDPEADFAKLAVTSLFVRTDCGWRLWHHQAGPVLTHLQLEVE
jgi:ketosteroid isomerase-like protein